MSKLFWILLAGCRGGYRYLRAALHALASGLVSRLGQAPGADGSARPEADAPALRAEPVARSVADGRFASRECGSLLGHMVAWLVSVGRFPARAETDLHTGIQASPAAEMTAPRRHEVELIRNAEVCPGIPMGHSRTAETTLTAGAESAPPVHMGGDMGYAIAALGACGISGGTKPVTASAGQHIRAAAGMAGGTPAVSRDTTVPVLPAMAARMMTWTGPERVNEKTLYIRQVYETQRDGDILILH